MKKNIKTFKLLIIPFVIGMFFIVTAIVMWLWNALLPELLGAKSISYWQAMGILVLSKILFGGFHGKGCKQHHKMEYLNRHEALGEWSDEEREKLREAWRNRCRGHFFGKKDN